MKNVLYILFLVLVSCHQFDSSRPMDFNDWVGSWKHTAEESVIFEAWKKASDTEYFGVNLTERNEEKKINETLKLQKREGAWVLIPTTVGQNPNPVEFKLVSNENRTATFSNPDHDFPKFIIYKMLSENSMEAKITDGAEKEMTWVFKKSLSPEQLGIPDDKNGGPLLK